MGLNNDIIDLTGAAGAADEFVIGGRVNQASGNLELDMNIGGNAAIQIPLLNSMPPDEYVTGARYNPGTGNIEIDMCIAGARAITFPLLNQLPKDVYVSNGVYDPSTMQITFTYSDSRADMVIDLSGIVMHEKAGANYDPNHEYSTGDVVSVPGSKILYIAQTSGILPDPVVSPTEWKAVGDADKERGGIAWDATIQYHAGDIVTIASDDELYIAMTDNHNSDPLLRTDWYEFGAARHIVGWFTPDDTNPPTSEYPDTTGQEPGAVWYTNGVDSDTGYVFTAGPFLGYTAHNNDKFVWYGYDSQGQDIWLFEPFPRISELERGGLQWKDNKDYKVDDIVALGQDIYVANADNTNIQPVTGAEWTALTLAEKGGLEYNDANTYNVGDIVSYNASIYTAINPVPPGHTPPDTGYWATPVLNEFGGRIWDSGATYQVGDVTTDGSNSKVYTALNITTGDTPSVSPGIWRQVGQDVESGGIAWRDDVSFRKGDIATNVDTFPEVAYISLNSNNLNNPLTDTNWWQELDSIYYNAPTGGRDSAGTPGEGVLHNPNNPVDEYPDVSQEHEGAIWYITGLGKDPTTGENIKYEFTTGPLTGVQVVDLDRIIWIDTDASTGDPKWLWSPFPRIKAEVGGIAWKSGWEYDKGDIVVDLADFMAYKSTLNNNLGNEPHLGSGWDAISPPFTDITYHSHVSYPKDSIVIIDGKLYYNPGPDDIPAGTVPPGGGWAELAPTERGGVHWASTINYFDGDIVSYNNSIWEALADNSAIAPGSDDSVWSQLEAFGSTPIGGIIMYDGPTNVIPSNWAICDGTNGTPNLVDRFIKGVSNDAAVGITGGSPNAVVVSHTHTGPEHTHSGPSHRHAGASHTHTATHSHTASSASVTNHYHMISQGYTRDQMEIGNTNTWLDIPSHPTPEERTMTDGGAHSHSITVNSKSMSTGSSGTQLGGYGGTEQTGAGGTGDTGEAGVDGAGRNDPLFYTLIYIKRIS